MLWFRHLSLTLEGQGCILNKVGLGLKLIQLEVFNVFLLDNQIGQRRIRKFKELKEEHQQ